MAAERPVARGQAARVLHGRTAELDRLYDVLDTVARGQSSVIVLSGEPGIGKTALTKAVVDQAEQRGFRTAYSAAHEDDVVTPLASLGPALRFGAAPLIDSADFMDLATLHEQPLWLAERLATLLEDRAQDTPLLLALDDAQWCDPLTRFTLRVLPQRLRTAAVAWVVSTRWMPGGGPAQQIADAAAPELPVVSIELTALSEDAVLAVAEDRLGARPDGTVLRNLARGRGNPFLTVQILDGLFEPGAADGSRPARVPAGLREGVRRRIAATSESCQRLLHTSAVLGQTFLLADVAALLDESSATQLTEPLVEAINAGLLVDDGSSVVFRHELLREAVYEDLPPSVRNVIHRAFAERLLAEERGYAAAAPHVLATATRGDSAAADVLRRAAHEVSDTMATTSVTFIRQAFELVGAEDPAWGEIGVEAVAILGAAHQFTDASRFADLLLAERIPAELHARVRLLLLPRLWALGRHREIVEFTREPAGEADLDARLDAYRALAAAGEAPTSDDPIAAALALTAAAERAQDREERRRAHDLFVSARVAATELTGYGAPDARELAARELAALARVDAIDEALRGLDDGTRFTSSWQAPQLALLRAQFALGGGRVEEAATTARTAAQLMVELHDFALEPELRHVLALASLLRGDTAEARTQLVAAADAGTDMAVVRALLADAEGDRRGAGAVVAAIRDGGAFWPEEWLVAAACSAHHRDDDDTVRASVAELARLAERNPDVAGLLGAHLLALALPTGDYERARDVLTNSPRALLATRADEEFGRYALDNGDRGSALAALDAAHDRYTELGATGPAERVQRIMQSAGVRRRRWAPVVRRPDTGWDALTEMERRVALLIADGHTNRSAAEELVLSPSTISTHLRAAFAKLDVHSRVQLANLVQRRNEAAAPQP